MANCLAIFFQEVFIIWKSTPLICWEDENFCNFKIWKNSKGKKLRRLKTTAWYFPSACLHRTEFFRGVDEKYKVLSASENLCFRASPYLVTIPVWDPNLNFRCEVWLTEWTGMGIINSSVEERGENMSFGDLASSVNSCFSSGLKWPKSSLLRKVPRILPFFSLATCKQAILDLHLRHH